MQAQLDAKTTKLAERNQKLEPKTAELAEENQQLAQALLHNRWLMERSCQEFFAL